MRGEYAWWPWLVARSTATSTTRSTASTIATTASRNSSTRRLEFLRASAWCSKKFMPGPPWVRGPRRLRGPPDRLLRYAPRSAERDLGRGAVGHVLDLQQRGRLEVERVGDDAAREHLASVVVAHDR